MKHAGLVSSFAFGLGLSWACAGDDTSADCSVGSSGCACTSGGGCDPGLRCAGGYCVSDEGGTEGTGTSSGGTGSSASSTQGTSSTATTQGPDSDSDEGGLKLDVGAGDTDFGPMMGCRAIDMLFVLDGSGSMADERSALSATNTFAQIVTTLAGLNGGDIDYRIGLTDDDDHGFIVPGGWIGANPWFDSQAMTTQEIASAFHGAVQALGGFQGASLGCEHVLTSGTHLIDGDTTGFVRDDALLVLVLLTDVDDYGAYDQVGGHSCPEFGGCSTPPPPLQGLLDTLVTAKNGQMDGVAAIVIAGDPSQNGGVNFCDQPASCGCTEVLPGFVDCDIFHATRLYQFAQMLGDNGHTANLCAGAASVPGAVETALTESIDLACMTFDPAG
jgi:hypothetical protein